MHIAIIGGKLQGTEAAYLAGKAGWEVTLIDKNKQAPARGLCHHFRHLDVCQEDGFKAAFKNVDIIIPAIEDFTALQAIHSHCRNFDAPLFFDHKAYQISRSKQRSNKLFEQVGVKIPAKWPNCGFPVIAKPSCASGSQGVCKLRDFDDYNVFRSQLSGENEQWVLQKYLDGPSYSLEVIGHNGKYVPLQVTELEMDETYDCKRVTAPSTLTEILKEDFNTIAIKLARALKLEGIMDVEVILCDEELFVLEIDARLPSQTPTAVLWSSGSNMLKLLWAMKSETFSGLNAIIDPLHVIYEHIHVMPGLVEIAGEHLMANPGPLQVISDFYGADEAITNYTKGKSDWVATLITADKTLDGVHIKRKEVLASLCQSQGIEKIKDTTPGLIGMKSQ